jgi:hypothetical protein
MNTSIFLESLCEFYVFETGEIKLIHTKYM